MTKNCFADTGTERREAMLLDGDMNNIHVHMFMHTRQRSMYEDYRRTFCVASLVHVTFEELCTRANTGHNVLLIGRVMIHHMGKGLQTTPAHMVREHSYMTSFYVVTPSTITRSEPYRSSLVYCEGKTTT